MAALLGRRRSLRFIVPPSDSVEYIFWKLENQFGHLVLLSCPRLWPHLEDVHGVTDVDVLDLLVEDDGDAVGLLTILPE